MNTGAEEWRDIPGYEGFYAVSTFGRVKRLARQRIGTRNNLVIIKERIKEPYPQEDGYLQIGLSKNGKKTSFLLHRLVGITFIPGDHSLEINHKDFERTNCRVGNLEWETRQGNVDYSHKNGRFLFKEARGITKLSTSDVIEIRTIGRLVSRKILSERYGVTTTNIGAIQRGLLWRHVA